MYPESEIIKDDRANPQNYTPNIFSELQKNYHATGSKSTV